MDEFDGILDRDDVIPAELVCLVDDGRQGRRFAAPGRSCDQDKSPGQESQLGDHVRQAQVLTAEDLARNLPEHGGTAPLLLEEVGAIAGQPRDFIGKVDIPGFFELLDLDLRGDFVKHGLQPVVVQGVVLDTLDLAADAKGRLLARHKVQVRGPCSFINWKKASILAMGFLLCRLTAPVAPETALSPAKVGFRG